MTEKNNKYFVLRLALFISISMSIFIDISFAQKQANTATENLAILSENMTANDLEEIRSLLAAGADINVKSKYGETALDMGAWNGYTAIVRLLLEAKADVNTSTITNKWTPLYMASRNHHIEIVKLLIEAGADVNAVDVNGTTLLEFMSWDGNVEIVKLLLVAKADVNAAEPSGATPLEMAAMTGHTEIVKLLIEAGADVNAADTDGDNALLSASKNGYPKVVKLLLDAKANVMVTKKRNGATPLYLASQFGQTEVVKLLLGANANVNTPNIEDNTTALYEAVENGYTEIVKLLLEAKADVNVKSNGFSPLYIASEKGNFEIVKLLLLAGANPNVAVSQKGTFKIQTPYKIANLNGHTEIADELITYMQKRFLNQNETIYFNNKVLELLEPFKISDLDAVQKPNLNATENMKTRNDSLVVSLISVRKDSLLIAGVYHRTGYKSALDVSKNRGQLVLGFFDANTNDNSNPFHFDIVIFYETDGIEQVYTYINNGWSH